MNTPYREGYRDGLSVARVREIIGISRLEGKEMEAYCREVYGRKNTKAANTRKAGFKDGYKVGLQAVEIERKGKRVVDGSDTITRGE